jgi:hypothetical protein
MSYDFVPRNPVDKYDDLGHAHDALPSHKLVHGGCRAEEGHDTHQVGADGGHNHQVGHKGRDDKGPFGVLSVHQEVRASRDQDATHWEAGACSDCSDCCIRGAGAREESPPPQGSIGVGEAWVRAHVAVRACQFHATTRTSAT